MNQYYVVFYLETGKMKTESFYTKDFIQAEAFAKEKKGYLILALRSYTFTE